MARLDDYNFIVTDLVKKQILDVVELSSGYWDEIYNRPGTGLFTARLIAPTTNKVNFRDWANGLFAIKGDEIVWGGVIGKTQRRKSTKVLSVPVHGFYDYLFSRYVRSAQGMSYAQVENVTDIAWRGVDQFRVVEDVVNHIQSFADGDIGIRVDYDSLSLETVTRVYPTFAFKNAGEIVDELASTVNGFDIVQDYEYVNGVPSFKLSLVHPATSTTWPGVLLHQPNKRIQKVEPILARLDVGGTSASNAISDTVTNVTNDLDFSMGIQRDDWTVSSSETLAGPWESTGNEASWRLDLETDLKLTYYWTTDGDASGAFSEESGVALPVVDGDEIAIRVTHDVDNGSGDNDVTLYYSTDAGLTWNDMKAPRLYGDTYGDEF